MIIGQKCYGVSVDNVTAFINRDFVYYICSAIGGDLFCAATVRKSFPQKKNRYGK